MAKKANKKAKTKPPAAEVSASASAAPEDAEAGPSPKMKTKDYEREMQRLHGELVAMQEWVKASGAKVCVVFEGRDTSGKGGTIKRIVERVSPRVFRVVALPAPTGREMSQMYIQRYLSHFPAAGEVVIFDRSWYNRAGVVASFRDDEHDPLDRSRPRPDIDLDLAHPQKGRFNHRRPN